MNQYKNYTDEQRENLFSQFLINSWSYSKVSAFARNEKAFEMQYIFGIYGKSSATTIAGQAYHEALRYYFNRLKDGQDTDIVDLEKTAFEYIDDVKPNFWKLQKTTPTVEECVKKAVSVSGNLIRNFIKEKSVYLDEIAEVIDVELNGEEFLTVNGVDIPLPCRFKIDMVVLSKEGKKAVIDHKSKSTFTDDEEIQLSIGVQAITYALGYEEMTGQKIDEVWFVENKHSANKGGGPQLVMHKVQLDINTRRLYESLLYEPLKRMVEAVNNPDYVYLINESDNLTDKAELYDFWARTMICEVEDFNVDEAKKELVAKRLKKVRDASIDMIAPTVIKKFRENAAQFIQYDLSNKNMTHEEKIEHVLRSFGVIVKVAKKFDGYSSDTFLLEVSAGVAVKSIHARRMDIANALNVSNVRISNEMVVYEGRSYVAVEYSKKRTKDLIFDKSALQGYKIPLGVDNMGNVVYLDLANHSTPHALICGATGSGKSVCVKNTIEYSRLAGVNNIIILDPKYEFTSYKNKGIVVANDIIEIEERMAQLVDFMEKLVKEGKKEMTLVVFDEFADAVANSRKGEELKIYEQVFDGFYANGSTKQKRALVGELKSLEENLRILLQKGRSCGIRVIAATQRASVKVITGDAKVNFPVQICFRVPKETDSRVVIDEPGAESLMGQGDGLIKSPEYNDVVRFQAYYLPE